RDHYRRAITFSQERLHRRRASLAVNVQLVSLLELLDRSHEVLTRLAVLLDAKLLLHRLHVGEALAPELVTARIQVRPVPRLGRHIIHPTITARIALQPGLDRATVNIDIHAIAVI